MKYSWLLIVLLVSMVSVCLGGGGISFLPLGDLPGGLNLSRAYAVSADGSVVVGYSSGQPQGQAFRWTRETGMVGLGTMPNGANTLAGDISADGSVILGGYLDDTSPDLRRIPFVWTEAEGMKPFGEPGQVVLEEAYAISGDGLVVVGGDGSRWIGDEIIYTEPYRWTAATGVERLGDLPGGADMGQAWDTSFDGSVVVGRSESEYMYEAFRWTSETGMIGLGGLDDTIDPLAFPSGGPWSEASAVSADGVVIAGSSRTDAGTEAFRWTSEAGMTSLGVPEYLEEALQVEIYAEAVSADGSVIVGACSSEVYFWTEETGIVDLKDFLTNESGLDLTGWTLDIATDISADGRTIVGYGYNPAGDREAWLAVVPEPSVFVLLLGGVVWCRGRKG